MKKILAIIAIAASMFAVNAQAQNAKSVAAAKAAVDKAQAAVENAKQNTKTATWLKYGQTLMDAYDAPAGNAWVGMSAQELQVLAGGMRSPSSESQVVLGGQTMPSRSMPPRTIYFNQNGQLAVIEVTQPAVENALDKAVEAYAKAAELDVKGQKTKDIKAALESINSKYTDEAYNAYTLGDLKKASVLFEKAVKAAGTAPLSAIDTNSIYNAGLTAWQSQDWSRAKGFFEECYKLGYYGEGGETFAKLADIADKLGDKRSPRSILEEGFPEVPAEPEHPDRPDQLLHGQQRQTTDRLFDLFDEAKKNEPNNASLYYVEGNARKKLGQNDEALAAYEKASQVNPNYEWGYIGKGIQLYDMAVDLQDKASQEMNDAKYMALMGEFEKTLKACIEPFEKAFELTKDNEIKANIAEYLKNACFRFRTEGDEYQAKYDKYNNFGK